MWSRALSWKKSLMQKQAGLKPYIYGRPAPPPSPRDICPTLLVDLRTAHTSDAMSRRTSRKTPRALFDKGFILAHNIIKSGLRFQVLFSFLDQGLDSTYSRRSPFYILGAHNRHPCCRLSEGRGSLVMVSHDTNRMALSFRKRPGLYEPGPRTAL